MTRLVCRFWHKWAFLREMALGDDPFHYLVIEHCTRCGQIRKRQVNQWDQMSGL